MKVAAENVQACSTCGRSHNQFQVVSSHNTASGGIRYVRCTCGALQVQQRSRFAAAEWQPLGGPSPVAV